MLLRSKFWKNLEEFLIKKGLHEPVSSNRRPHDILKNKKNIEDLSSPAELTYSIKTEQFGYESIDMLSIPCPPADLLKYINPAYAKNYKIIPLKYEKEILTIAMAEPDPVVLDEVVSIYKNSLLCIEDVKIVITSAKKILDSIDRFYLKEDTGIGNILSQIEETFKPNIEVVEVPDSDITENSAPIVMLVNKTIKDAFNRRVSDIHIEPASDYLRIRYRIDGDLIEVMRVPKYAQNAFIARIKVMADMKLDERRLPQDGRIDFTKYIPLVEIDVRVSTVPTPLGEDVVMRILDKKNPVLSLDMVGFSMHDIKLYTDALHSPYGIILHVGPTGSGKTTALYAALKSLDTPDVKIVTAEDPVEYALGGQIMQSNINPLVGYTFAKAIRAFMRHDPDIILIGEIRDIETAKTAVEASLTGHLVFSTLHTNDAVGTVTRLTEMGIEPYLLADSLRLICAQRLVRKICLKCRESYIATDKDAEMTKNDIKFGTTIYKGRGCDACEGSGYKGRTGIYEVFSMNRTMRGLLLKGATTEELKDVAIKTGMRTLRQDAIEKALSGITTIEQVVATTSAET